MRRLRGFILLAALAVAGCGADQPAAPQLAAAPVKAKHVRIVPKRRFVRRVNAICRRFDRPSQTILASMPAITADVTRNRRVWGAYVGRAHRLIRATRRRMVRLGLPSRDRARWNRAMSKLLATQNHLDTMRAAMWAGSVRMIVLSAQQLRASAHSTDRRFRRFGAHDCVGF